MEKDWRSPEDHDGDRLNCLYAVDYLRFEVSKSGKIFLLTSLAASAKAHESCDLQTLPRKVQAQMKMPIVPTEDLVKL